MPASSVEVIGAALQSAFRHKPADTGPLKKSGLEGELVASSKQVLLNHVDYDRVGSQQSMALASLKTKYVNLSAITGTSTPTPPTSPAGSAPPNTMAQAHHHNHNHSHHHHRKDDMLEDPRVVLWSRDKVSLGWRKSFPPGAGMVNLGNTCYMNSSLQALFHIPAMANWLMEDLSSHTQRCETNSSNASYCSICAMMRTLRLTLDRSNNVIKPSLIQHKLKSIGKTLMYGRQEDAHEFIKLLLDHMEKSYLSFRRATKLDHRSKETTPLNQIFGGYLRQQVICPLCRHVSTTFSHFQDLVLDIRSVNSVDEALNLHFRKETLDSENAYKCERCHKKVSATKRHLIERAPHVLLIQLKRFTYSGGKISKHVNIQRNIDLSRFVNGAPKGGPGGPGPYQYRLSSMVIHIGGSQHGGHYTAVAEASNGTMFEFDDSSVRSISVQTALLRNPYILFYEMVRKPKDPTGIKQVVRQSSEKTLIRQNSDGIARPLPTSHSASSVANGYSHSDGETASKNGIFASNKAPLPTHKEREKIVIGLKFNHNNSKGESPSKPSKIILKPGTSSLLGNKPSTSKTTSSPSKTNSSPSKTNSSPSKTTSSLSNSSSSISSSKNASSKTLSSLVPYPDDSEESESDETRRPAVNGHGEKPIANGKAKGEGEKVVKENGVKCGKAEKVNGFAHSPKSDRSANSDKNAKHSDSENGAKGSGSKSGSSTPFLPRSLQVNTSANHTNDNTGTKLKPDLGWTVSNAANHSPSESSNSSGGSNTNTFTVVDQPTSTKPKPDLIKPPKELEKLQNHGWTITVRPHRPELEKSHSHDSVLPGPSVHRRDEPDSASLRSKASVDSTRSDRSTKSMKKSLFSLFTCVTSARSPDSPEEEQPQALPPEKCQESKTKPSNGQAKLAEPEDDLSNDSSSSQNPGSCRNEVSKQNGHTNGKEAESEGDAPQSKRFRDGDDNEPSSPSKKCRPELKHSKNFDHDSKNGSVSSVSKNGLSCDSDKSKNTVMNGDIPRSKNGVATENAPSKNGFVDGGREGKSTGKSGKIKKEGKSAWDSDETPKATQDASSSASSLSSELESSGEEEDKEGTERWVEKTKDSQGPIGFAKTNANAHVVDWSSSIQDLSHTLSHNKEKNHNKQPEKRKQGMWDGSRNSSVVDELRKAGNFAFGTEVNSWSGSKSSVDTDYQKDRHEARKRTADDLYNEEFDRGKTKKIKNKKWEGGWNNSSGNAFQKVQDHRNNGTWEQPHNSGYNQFSYNNNNSSSSNGNYWNNRGNDRDNRYNNQRGGHNNHRGGHNNYRGGHNNHRGGHTNHRGGHSNNQRGGGHSSSSKPWDKFHQQDHKFHKKHKERYKNWGRRD